MSRFNEIAKIYDYKLSQLRDPQVWQNTLRLTSNFWRLNFCAAMLLTEQNPKAVMCGTLAQWNNVGRYVRHGERSTAIFMDRNNTELMYLFDVTQTYGTAYNAKWKLSERMADGIVGKFNAENAENAVSFEDFLKKSLDKNIDIVYNYDSKLNNSMAIDPRIANFIRLSAECICMTRCGIEADYDFSDAVKFNSDLSIVEVGNAATALAQEVLRDVDRTVRRKEYERYEAGVCGRHLRYPLRGRQERTAEPEIPELWKEGHDAAGAQGGRYDERNGSDSARPGEHERAVSENLEGDWTESRERQEPHNTYSDEEGAAQPDLHGERTAEDGNRYSGSGSSVGFDSDERDLAGGGSQEPWTADEDQGYSSEYDDEELNEDNEMVSDETDAISVFSDRPEEIDSKSEYAQKLLEDEILHGNHSAGGKFRITEYISDNSPTNDEFAKFLKNEYGQTGKGFEIGSHPVSVWFDEHGMSVGYGTQAKETPIATMNWEDVESHIRSMVENGMYMSASEAFLVDTQERKRVANQIFFFLRDGMDEAPEEIGIKAGNYPDSEETLMNLLSDHEGREKIRAIIQDAGERLASGEATLRWRHVKSPEYLLSEIADLDREKLEFPLSDTLEVKQEDFITQDEIDYALGRGSGYSNGAFRIYDYFTEGHDKKETVAFLKNEYGIGGGSGGLPGNDDSHHDHDGKGIRLEKGSYGNPYAKVLLNWNVVEKRLRELITEDKYLSAEGKVKYREYKEEQARTARQRELDRLEHGVRLNCKNAIESTIAETFDGFILPRNTADAIVNEYGMECVEFVLANTIRHFDYDGRFSLNNKEWAKGIVAENEWQNNDLLLSTHPAVLDGFTNQARRYINVLREKQREAESTVEKSVQEQNENATDEQELEWHIIHEADDENGKPTEWSTTIAEGQFLWIDKEENGYSIYDTADTGSNPLETFETLDQAKEWVEELVESGKEMEDELSQNAGQTSEIAQVTDIHELQDGDWVALDSGYTVDILSNQELHFNSDAVDLIGYDTSDGEGMRFKADNITEIHRNNELIAQLPDELDSIDTQAAREKLENGEADRQTEEMLSQVLTGEWEPVTLPSQGENKPIPDKRNAVNFHISNDDLGVGTPKEKFRRNVEAIKLLGQIEGEHRYATPQEQEILSQYVGWGGLADAFDEGKQNWTAEYQELKNLLSPEEYRMARESTLNAHYTSPAIIRSMYDAIEKMGFTKGNILEPSMGIGNFFGMMPDSMKESRLYGMELDGITGRIAKQLYPQADVQIKGFEKTDYPNDFFDIAIGNVPFGQYKVADRAYDKNNFLIHDYFFAKTLDKVRPGGVVAFITSKGTMDKASPDVRRYLAQRADLLGAVRLPNTAFKANAGTEVTSDILFFQKRDRMVEREPDWVHLSENADGIALNSYFAEHPEQIVGKMEMVSGPYGMESTCKPDESRPFEEQLKEAVGRITGQIDTMELDEELEDELGRQNIPADPNVKNFSYTVAEKEVYYRENSVMKPVEVSDTVKERIKGMVAIRNCTQELIDMQLNDYGDTAIKEKQAELNSLYDAFSKKYGLINSQTNKRAFSQDSSYCLLCSLEKLDDEGNFKGKADMFTKRTIKKAEVVTSVDTASEALAVSLGEKAKVDLAYMEGLTGKDKDTLTEELRGVIFQNPLTDAWETADEYLSGNVREKLEVATTYAENHPEYAVNVQALQQVQPKELDASEIEVRIGATWIATKYIEDFMRDTFETPEHLFRRDVMGVQFSKVTGEWNVKGKNADYGNSLVNMTYGTSRVNAYKILEDSLNLKDTRVYDTIEEDGKEKRVLNKKETMIASQKQEGIREAFKDWVFRDPERRQVLVAKYNELFNSTRPREYDGSHLKFPGMTPDIELKPHQKNAVAHVLYGNNTLLAHCVGAGKTFEMTAAAMESKRLGLCQKSLFVVPNHLTEQWASDFLRLYPGANIFAATKKDFEPANRKKFCSRIATGDYDAVIIGHSQFEKIPLSVERQTAIIERQIDEIELAIEQTKADKGERYTIKQMEKSRKALQVRLDKLNDQTRKDNVVTFEQLGVDRLFVDESHSYKNLFLYTKMRNVAGIAQTEAQKSSDMFAKCQYLDEITGGKGVTFATGTPISNSMTELYTNMRYLQYDTLQKLGLGHFDAWAASFGETQTAIELAPEGYTLTGR